MAIAVVAKDLAKTYRIYASVGARLAELVFRTSRHLAFPALSDEQERGHGLALTGENGALASRPGSSGIIPRTGHPLNGRWCHRIQRG